MAQTLRRIASLFSLLLLIGFGLFLVNQTAQVVALAERVHPTFAEGVFWGLLLLYAVCLLVPLYMLLRLPRPLVPPPSAEGPEFEAHLRRLAKRLARNSHLRDSKVESRADIENALRVLDARADAAARDAASEVFLTTAISQSGALDSVMVLAAQSTLVLQIARTYYQRPTLRDLTYLYGNVATTAFLSSELDDVDLSNRVQPIMAGVLGSAAGAIPGLGAASSLVVNSVATGSANAFLLLRTGMIAKGYCSALVLPRPSTLRRSATLQATGMLGAIVRDGAATVAAAIWKGSTRAVGQGAAGLGGSVKSAGGSVADVGRSVRSAGAAVVDKLRPANGTRSAASPPERDQSGA